MISSSIESNISSAEELTEQISISDDHERQHKNSLNDYINTSEVMIENASVGNDHEEDCGGHSMTSSSTYSMYSTIKPEHVRILDLHVDPDLKPNYISQSNKDSIWLGSDSSIEESKKKSIIRYLSVGKSGPDVMASELCQYGEGNDNILRTLSNENVKSVQNQLQWSRRGSLDDAQRLRLSRDKGVRKCGSVDEWLDKDGNVMEEAERDSGALVEGLEFQASLRNERCHFMFADLLTEGLEMMVAEESISQARQASQGRGRGNVAPRSSTSQESESGTSTYCSPYQVTSSSNAETTALAVIDEIMVMLDQLSVHDGRQRTLPGDLQTLLVRLEKKCLLSMSFDMTSSQLRSPSHRNSYNQANTRSSDSDSPVTEALIKSAIGSVTINLPVGGCPVLGPDMSLPNYVVSRSPPPSKRSAILSLQQNTCPGCHSIFQPEIARRLRLCRYYWLYFCSVCHSNTLMLIPARILAHWDFTMLPVSRPARDLLQLIHAVPLFLASHFAASVRSSLPVLASVCRLRRQGRLLLTFIEVCRQGVPLTALLSSLPLHWFSETHPPLFSVADFRLMEAGRMEPLIRDVVAQFIEHISLCPVCQARGFFCEIEACDRKDQIIFPFEMDLVGQCPQCSACFHLRCYKQQATTASCPRCQRRRLRHQVLADNDDYAGSMTHTTVTTDTLH